MMRAPSLIETRCEAATPSALARAAAVLRAGGLVAFPTETVYGLGADATSDRAVAGIYEAKGRPSFNPLIAHLASHRAAFAEGEFSKAALRLAEAFWPGPLTLVVPAAPTVRVSSLARAGLDTVALRLPDHPIAKALIAEAGLPIVAPSANRSGHVSPTRAEHVARDLEGRVHMILDAGPSPIGVESTIVACVGCEPVLLRPGGVTRQAIEAVLGHELRGSGAVEHGQPLAPGLLASHYAPRSALRLDAGEVQEGEAALDFAGSLRLDRGRAVAWLDLSSEGDLREAAANLFSHLRGLDAAGAGTIAVAPIPKRGLGEAINDRLARAAAPKGGAF